MIQEGLGYFCRGLHGLAYDCSTHRSPRAIVLSLPVCLFGHPRAERELRNTTRKFNFPIAIFAFYHQPPSVVSSAGRQIIRSHVSSRTNSFTYHHAYGQSRIIMHTGHRKAGTKSKCAHAASGANMKLCSGAKHHYSGAESTNERPLQRSKPRYLPYLPGHRRGLPLRRSPREGKSMSRRSGRTLLLNH